MDVEYHQKYVLKDTHNEWLIPVGNIKKHMFRI